MIGPKFFFDALKDGGIEFFTGVPDSLLKDFCGYISENAGNENHIINSNEGAAVSIAAGYYLATDKPALVYMQNSGLGNAINPLLSLADKEVYSVPMILLIGWRGEPGKKDEPQHVKQGRVMLKMLDAMEIPYDILNSDSENIETLIKRVSDFIKEKKCPYALVVSDGTFEEYKSKSGFNEEYGLNREGAIEIILENIESNSVIVSTTGKTSREVFEYRERCNLGHGSDFLTVGSMGHCCQIALGISLQKKDKQVYVLDGDGSVIMHMGSLSIIGTEAGENFKHIILNNGAHDSVGGQPTSGFKIDFASAAKACGYKNVFRAETGEQIKEALVNLRNSEGPSLLEIRINKGARKDLGRPTTTPIGNKENFMEFLSK